MKQLASLPAAASLELGPMRPSWHKKARWLSSISLCFTFGCGRTGGDTTVPLELVQGPPPVEPQHPEEIRDPLPIPPEVALEPEPDDPRRDIVQAAFDRECSACHAAGTGGYLDLDFLVDNQYLVPTRAETSPLVLWFKYGPSRVEHAGVTVGAGEFDALVGYTNSLDAAYDCPGYQLTDRDRAAEHLLLDITARPPEDRPFIRYVGATPANQRYGCNDGLPEISAFLGFVNSVSLGPSPVFPGELIGSGSLAPIFAVDMRDLGWAEPVDVDGLGPGRFADRWEAIAAAASPYALELEGPEADALKRETGTSLPFVPAAAFVSVASVGALYYALVGVGQDVNALAQSLGVTDEGSPQRAGVFGAGSWPDRVIRRRARAAPGHSWWTREELAWAGAGPRPLAEDPVGYPDQGSEIIFSLPNGYFAFAIADSDGLVRNELLNCVGGGTCATPVRAENSITCRGCHGGLHVFSDEVLPHLNTTPSPYPAALVPIIRDQYRPGLSVALEADNFTNGTAMETVNGHALGAGAGRTYYKFTARPLSVIDVADELAVTVEQLRAGIATLGAGAPELTPLLADGSVERAQLTPRFQALACSISGFRNVPANCP
jgi:hypothetical protein